MQAAAAPRLSVSALAAEAGVPIARIKFYLREGVLQPADLSAAKRGYYGAQHLQRLRLIFALRQVAGLGMASIRTLCALLDRPHGTDAAAIIARVIDALGKPQPRTPRPTRELLQARAELRAMLAAQGTRVRPQARAVEQLAQALVELRRTLGPGVSADAFIPYLDAMCSLAERDFHANAALFRDRSDAALAATWGTVLWEPVLILLRRIAHEHVAAQQLSAQPHDTKGGRP